MDRPTLDTLPREISLLVISYLPSGDALQMRRVSRGFNELIRGVSVASVLEFRRRCEVNRRGMSQSNAIISAWDYTVGPLSADDLATFKRALLSPDMERMPFWYIRDPFAAELCRVHYGMHPAFVYVMNGAIDPAPFQANGSVPEHLIEDTLEAMYLFMSPVLALGFRVACICANTQEGAVGANAVFTREMTHNRVFEETLGKAMLWFVQKRGKTVSLPLSIPDVFGGIRRAIRCMGDVINPTLAYARPDRLLECFLDEDYGAAVDASRFVDNFLASIERANSPATLESYVRIAKKTDFLYALYFRALRIRTPLPALAASGIRKLFPGSGSDVLRAVEECIADPALDHRLDLTSMLYSLKEFHVSNAFFSAYIYVAHSYGGNNMQLPSPVRKELPHHLAWKLSVEETIDERDSTLDLVEKSADSEMDLASVLSKTLRAFEDKHRHTEDDDEDEDEDDEVREEEIAVDIATVRSLIYRITRALMNQFTSYEDVDEMLDYTRQPRFNPGLEP